ncbi:MAG: RNA polymerase sporulation sigma factor SigK [Clostridia bacterium]|nr:RNA polymerase sporulation sigma factor SigK [Clostridia bacterium]
MIFETLGVFLSKVMCFSAYVQDATHFPRALTKEEENVLVKKIKLGDENARNELIEHNLRLVAHVVKKFNNCGEADDLIGVGTIGLIKAIKSYNPDKNVTLSTYASRCIENEILMLLRSSKKHLKTQSLEEVVASDKDGNELTFGDTLEDNDESVDEIISRKYLMKDIKKIIAEKLTEREQIIINLRYGLTGEPPMPQREVAKRLNISRSYISRIEVKALQIIRETAIIKGINP